VAGGHIVSSLYRRLSIILSRSYALASDVSIGPESNSLKNLQGTLVTLMRGLKKMDYRSCRKTNSTKWSGEVGREVWHRDSTIDSREVNSKGLENKVTSKDSLLTLLKLCCVNNLNQILVGSTEPHQHACKAMSYPHASYLRVCVAAGC
jgi:hypothetical protein